jgi:hypothetical protein
MGFYSFILENRELFKIAYALIIVLICTVIVLRTNKIFRLSSHPGIRYFRNAFFFYGIAFFSRYILSLVTNNSQIPIFLFEFFAIMAGFFLLYSLLWKKFELKFPESSLFNLRIVVFYLMAIILVVFDILWNSLYFLFFSQIIIFLVASIISFINFKRKLTTHKFTGFYFLAMLLMLFAWIINLLLPSIFLWNNVALINVYIFNTIFFLVFLYGVVKITKK